ALCFYHYRLGRAATPPRRAECSSKRRVGHRFPRVRTPKIRSEKSCARNRGQCCTSVACGSRSDTSVANAAVRRFYEQVSVLPTENSIADILSSQRKSPPPSISQIVSAHAGSQLPEFELLRSCCRGEQNVLRAFSRNLGWDQVFEQASYHRVLPALYRALQGRPEVPASIQSALRARYLRHCQRVM